jgi:CheY-like chemotaxis protein
MANSHPTGSNSPRHILVVDDDASTCLLCATGLKKAGYRVLEAPGSSEAMTLYVTSATPIDLLLTDLFLPPPNFQISSANNRCPRVNGHGLVRQVLSLKHELRVLFMSSHTISH